MKTSRNDPCPCGSGKKYKACCMGRDMARQRAARTLGPEAVAEAEARVEEAARRAPFWDADVVPLSGGTFTETGTPGALAIVGAGGFILTGDVLGRRSAGAPDRARAVLAAVMAAGRDAGLLPERLRVRDAALADALRPELERRGMEVEVASLAELDEAVDAALERLSGSVAGGKAFTLWTWAETEASPQELAEFHAAAAGYHRAAPWRVLPDGDPLLLVFPDEDQPWAASAMGGAGIHVGLALYSDPADVTALFDAEGDTDASVGSIDGYSLSMSYDAAGDLPKPMRREVAAAGWEVAGQAAYPTLMAICIPGRRITAEHVRRTALACRTITAFIQAQPDELPWTAPTGVTVDFLYESEEPDDEPRLPWPALVEAHPVGPAGPNADPEASVRAWSGQWHEYGEAEIERMQRYDRWLHRQKPSRAAFDRDMRAATLWASMLISNGVPAQSATEFELRTFLYLYLPSERYPKPVGVYLTRSLRRLFAFYAQKEGIEYPWADGVLDELDDLAGGNDVREVLKGLREPALLDVLLRALRPTGEVPGTPTGWMLVMDEDTMDLRHELHRRWLVWHDELVRGGTTDVEELLDGLVGRQRQWENTPHPRCEGRTPKQVLMEMIPRAAEALAVGSDRKQT